MNHDSVRRNARRLRPRGWKTRKTEENEQARARFDRVAEIQMQTGRADVIEDRIFFDLFARSIVSAHHSRAMNLHTRLAPTFGDRVGYGK